MYTYKRGDFLKGLVSVIIPVYNCQEVLEECVLSVTAQTYQNFEIILIDDGSQDVSPEICARLSKGDPRIKFFATEHGGASVARNKGIDEAKGEYIFFIDSDDVIHPCLLADLVKGAERDNSKIATCDVLFITNNHWRESVRHHRNSQRVPLLDYKPQAVALDDFFRGDSPLKALGGTLIRRDFLGETRFKTDLFIGEDFYFIYENLIKGADCSFMKAKRYYARVHRNSVSWSYSYSDFHSRFTRRRLVWKNEEKLGRQGYANMQKIDAFKAFRRCMSRNNPYSRDAAGMRRLMKKYRSELIPAYDRHLRFKLFVALYLPFAYGFVSKLNKDEKTSR